MGNMKEVPLSGKKARGRVALVDDEDWDLVSRFSWWVVEDAERGAGPYACATVEGRRQEYMHKLLADAPGGVDHVDGNGLNNQRRNLRPANQSQNNMNARKQAGRSSRYKGVHRVKRTGKWQAYINLKGKRRNLGTFATEEEAAGAYDAAARELFGEFARLNLPYGVTAVAS